SRRSSNAAAWPVPSSTPNGRRRPARDCCAISWRPYELHRLSRHRRARRPRGAPGAGRLRARVALSRRPLGAGIGLCRPRRALAAARAGGYTLAPLLRAIRADSALQVQTGGGVRHEDDVAAILDAGAARVVVGSLAVRERERVAGWIERFGAERIVVALDV